jgi:hypothetical protein
MTRLESRTISLIPYPKDGDSKFLRNITVPIYKTSSHRIPEGRDLTTHRRDSLRDIIRIFCLQISIVTDMKICLPHLKNQTVDPNDCNEQRVT